MLIIAITPPQAIDGEAATISRLLANGFDIVHLRKPEADIDYCRELLSQLSHSELKRIVVHDHFTLYEEYPLRGVHINRNITHYPPLYRGSRTRSCHSFEEVKQHKEQYDYIFLSPIFDSISKRGYYSKFCHRELQRASDEGIIDNRVVALGGVSPDKIAYLESLHFGGAAMMGAAYL